MKIARIYGLAARALFALFAMLTAWYCLLAYLPFTYHQVHQGGLLPWLDTFARLHAWGRLLILGILIPSLRGAARKGGAARWLAIGFVVTELAQAAVTCWHPVLPALRNDRTSYLWSFAPLASLVWLAAIDAVTAGMPEWAGKPATGERRVFRAALTTGLCLGALSLAIAILRFQGLPEWRAVLATFAGHLAVLLMVFLAVNWIAALAAWLARPGLWEFVLAHLAGAAVVAGAIQYIACPPIGLLGPSSWIFSISFGLTLAAAHAGASLSLDRGFPSGLDAATGPIRELGPWLTLAALCVLAPLVSLRVAAMDWNFLLQKLTAAALWGLTFGVFFALAPEGRARRPRALAYVAATLALLGTYRALEAAILSDPSLGSYAGYDVSYQLVREILAPHTSADPGFYRFLARNTNIGHSVPVQPVEQNLVEHLAPAASGKPDIFIFTFDSLRRDYLSPYNLAVTFTPEIARFAQESAVFQNAFTHYGGTGLSEPSIWAGSLLLHKQYVTPFAPMNVLEKMLRVDGYETFITRDGIVAALSPTPEPGDLDRHLSGMDYDLCRSLEELSSRLDERGTRPGPVFAYTQPQNLHISVIQREGASAPPGKPYPGFYAPYASRLERMDSCFGKFVRHLKEAGRYDRSLIVLTADHGDSLGEEGRWGHAYTIFPEVVRIPLLIHLPQTSGALGSDASALTFSTDIAPSLYYLLGHRPVLRGELAGRPLFTETEAERKLDPAVPQLLVSSYAPVYGTLTEGGRKLYIADGVNDRDYLFSIEGNLTRSLPVTDSIKSRNEASIREWIGRVNHAYRFGGESAR